uniref:Uncharacterized protein n=1 Tax=Cacopsylla melanoneura TaxID=428564 RepID=A0A8D8XIL5_9HEMI
MQRQPSIEKQPKLHHFGSWSQTRHHLPSVPILYDIFAILTHTKQRTNFSLDRMNLVQFIPDFRTLFFQYRTDRLVYVLGQMIEQHARHDAQLVEVVDTRCPAHFKRFACRGAGPRRTGIGAAAVFPVRLLLFLVNLLLGNVQNSTRCVQLHLGKPP